MKNLENSFNPEKAINSESENSYRSMEGMVNELKEASKFEHISEGDREIIRSPEHGDFVVRRVMSSKDPIIKDIHKMMVDEFGEEADPLYWLKESIKQGINNYDVVTTPDGRLVSVSNTRYLESESDSVNQTKQSFVFIAYILTDDNFRGKGIATEIYQKFYSGTLERARSQGHIIKGIIGEAVETVEPFLNKMGRKRVYFEDDQGNVNEVPYLCPPMDYDSNTGEPSDEGSFEHLMLRMVDNKQNFDVNELLKMVKVLYEEEYGASEEDYKNKNAYNKAMEKIMSVYAELESILSKAKDGKVFLMSAEERREKIKQLHKEGKEIKELIISEEDKE